MRSAVHRIDVVRKREHRLRVSVVILQRNLHRDVIALGLHVDRLVVQHLLALVEVLDELRDAADVLELLRPSPHPLRSVVRSSVSVNLQSLVQERQLAQPLRQRVEVELRYGEDALVRQKVDLVPLRFDGPILRSFEIGAPLE